MECTASRPILCNRLVARKVSKIFQSMTNLKACWYIASASSRPTLDCPSFCSCFCARATYVRHGDTLQVARQSSRLGRQPPADSALLALHPRCISCCSAHAIKSKSLRAFLREWPQQFNILRSHCCLPHLGGIQTKSSCGKLCGLNTPSHVSLHNSQVNCRPLCRLCC